MKNPSKLPFFFLLVLSILVFMACPIEDSADVNQDKIYTDYEVFYNSNTDKTQVLAKFRFGGVTGTLLELKEPAQVKFNEDKLAFKPIYGGHFKEYAGRITEGNFMYTNVDGITYQNDIPSYETIGHPQGLDTLSKSVAYTYVWEGKPLSENESVGLFIGSWTWGQDALFLQNSPGATNLILGTDKLGKLAVGSSTFFMDRASQLEVNEGTSEGGFIRSKYRALNAEVLIVE